MARAHYQMAIRDYNERYVQSKKFYFEDGTTVNFNENSETFKSVKENEAEE